MYKSVLEKINKLPKKKKKKTKNKKKKKKKNFMDSKIQGNE
jgi:hypothetical protein